MTAAPSKSLSHRGGIHLSVVIPAFNEEDRIVPTLKQTMDFLGAQAYASELIVVSDGSTDKTGQVVAGFRPEERVQLRFFEYHPNRGKGYAVGYGMQRAAGEIRMFMDADYSVPMEEVNRGLELLRAGWDIAIASRGLAESEVAVHQNTLREWSAKIYTCVQNRYLKMNFRDTQCGFKLFRAAPAADLFARQKLHSVIFDPEILWLAGRRGYRVAEFPVRWTHVGASRIQYDSLQKFLFVFQELLRIKKLHTR